MQINSRSLGPGKTSPRLIADLLEHNPARKSGFNLLIDRAPRFKDGVPEQARRNDRDCRHKLVLKDNQTVAPTSLPTLRLPDETTKYVVAAYCQLCKWHFHITADYWAMEDGQRSCYLGDKENWMHHLRYTPEAELQQDLLEAREYHFACSASRCPVIVKILMYPPRLSPALLQPITNTTILKARGEETIRDDPVRFAGFFPLTPINALTNLRTFLVDAKDTPSGADRRRIAKRNKKFCLAFNDDCNELFDFLGFNTTEAVKEEVKEDVVSGTSDAYDYFWQLPIVNEHNKGFIDDVVCELAQLLSEYPEIERNRAHVSIYYAPTPAFKSIACSLGYFGYVTRCRAKSVDESEHPHYANLGALDNFPDDSISWAYDRQVLCDPENAPYYLDCLFGIANGRESSDLQVKVSLEKSTGKLPLLEIEEAYNFFCLAIDRKLSDDHIIGVYTSYIQSAPLHKDQAREYLRVIGKARDSKKIESIAMNMAMTYEEALELLAGVNADTASDMVQAVAAAIMFDAANDTKKRVPYALLLVGKKKGADGDLQSQAELLEAAFDMTARSDTFDNDLESAYQSLDFKNRLGPDMLVWQYYKHGNNEGNLNAVYTIAMARRSKQLLALVDPELVPNGALSLTTSPIGLDNIGNTCYLNSILQFYYTIKPIRDVVAGIDTYRMDLDSPTIDKDIKKKKVGGRNISRSEIKNAQKFVYGLRTLFEQLKTSPTQSVRPTTELANLTLLSDQKVAQYRRDSVTSPGGRLAFEEISENVPIYGPDDIDTTPVFSGPEPQHLISPVLTPEFENDMEMVDRPTDKKSALPDDSSDSTLVDADTTVLNSDTNPLEDKKNIVEQVNTSAPHNIEQNIVMENIESSIDHTKTLPAPEKPPPVPPRKKQADENLWAFGAQQDVTEVVGNVVFRLQCAIKPESFEEGTGEQRDRIRDTFYGANATYLQKAEALEKKVESWGNLIIYPSPAGPCDIYEALDVTFDMQTVEFKKGETEQYSSITQLPPVLQMHIQRTAYDVVKKQPWKNMNAVHFPEVLYMDRYMDTDDETLLQRRSDAWKWKAELQTLQKRQATLKADKLTVEEALVATKKFVSSLQELESDGVEDLDISPSLPDALDERIAKIRVETAYIESEITTIKSRLRDQFADMRQYEYRLQTVFIHRGQSGSGHYWIYIYDLEHSVWREYNDERVSEVHDTRQVFGKDGIADGTPYYLAYVRSTDCKNLVNAVVRDVTNIPDDSNSEDLFQASHIENVGEEQVLPQLESSTDPIRIDENMVLDAHGNPW
ncbi:ubiquitin C-terminal hydrolase-like protein [Calycina marina]|uniref:ubiquitinyl hydrolase 1 n=1 Tax=Calycina marina TaxID=1763456 RepID=A0A9P7YZU1_9HELO|nr:ubiquitin C-terminal hydrolase-like protein [Calycina marina]